MGSPSSILLADVFVAKLENGALQNIIEELPTYCRFVDNISVLLCHNMRVKTLVDKFNQSYNTHNFTSEEEWENSFYFLDMKLTKTTDGKLTHRVYRKSTWTEQCTRYASLVPPRHKQNLVRLLASHVRNIYSKWILEG